MTKLIFSTGLVLLSVTAFGQRDIDVLHYKYEIELSDRSDSIKAKATIQVKFNQPSDKFWLDLAAPNKAGKGMLAYKFLEGDNKSLSGKQTGNKLELLLSAPAEKDEIKSFTIEYNGIPADGLIISKTKYGHRSFFADNWPNRGHNWLPCVDDPADKATVEFIVSAPQHYQVVANGIQIEETNLANGNKRTHWKEEVPVATKVMVIGVADFAVNLAGTIDNCIPVYYAQANEILPFFIKHVGPYGYKKLANVQSKTTFGGLENANTIFYHENSINGQRRSEALMAHEIAHQWFGN
ncbi:MAG TPA: M1 family aminopeptidase, partial [Chitinophagaceae bacterium]|nr:M1 family aminopeptidase [Chitinophagaceae bacterium]